MRRRFVWWALLCVLLFAVSLDHRASAETSQYFPQTGHSVSGKFLVYWQQNGGLPVFGYPITDAQNAVDPETGKTFLTQWFERRRFELHPENAGTPYEILGGLIGKDLRREAFAVDPDYQPAVALPAPARYFSETKHNVSGDFLTYWQQNGGLDRYGYPIDEAHNEVDPETGKVFVMQWFERARFELHPEAPQEYRVLLGLLGNQIKAPKTHFDFSWKNEYGGNALKGPFAVAVDSVGNIYAADTFNDRILKYDSGGNLLLAWGGHGVEAGRFDRPSGIVLDSHDSVYVADWGNQRIEKFDSAGNFVLQWGGFKNGSGLGGTKPGPINDTIATISLATDAQGNIYVTDEGNYRIQKFDAQGHLLFAFGSQGEGAGQFQIVQGVAVDAQGNIYVGDSARVQKFDATGKYLLTFKLGKGDEFIVVTGLAVDASGNILVTDASMTKILRKFTPNGEFIGAWTGLGADYPLNYARKGVVDDKHGTVYIADTWHKQIQTFTTGGSFVRSWSSATNAPTELSVPVAAATDSHNNLFVADSANCRVLKYDQSGRVQQVWGECGTRTTDFREPAGIATDPQDNVYVSDAAAQTIKVFDNSGRFLRTIGTAGGRDGQLFSPRALAIDAQGGVYVADVGNNRMQKFDAQGRFVVTWRIRTPALHLDYVPPQAVAVDAQKHVAVGAVGSEGMGLQIFDANGNAVTNFLLGSNDTLCFPFNVASDRQIIFYSLCPTGITAFDYMGNITATGNHNPKTAPFSARNPADGQLSNGAINAGDSSYTVISIDRAGSVYIIDSASHRISKFVQH